MAATRCPPRGARRWGAPFTLGRTLRHLGEVRGPEGEACLREAVELLAPTPYAVERARTQLALARLPEVPDGEAVPLLLAARDDAHDAGAHGLRDAVTEVLLRRGQVVPEQCTDREVLTTTERRVLELTRAGLDVREVAQQLFLTPGTVRATLDALMAGGLK